MVGLACKVPQGRPDQSIPYFHVGYPYHKNSLMHFTSPRGKLAFGFCTNQERLLVQSCLTRASDHTQKMSDSILLHVSNRIGLVHILTHLID